MKNLNIALEITEPKTGLTKAVLNELIEQLQIFADTGIPHVIDLTSLPMNTSDKQELQTVLGQGEVNITLSTIGDSLIYETGYSGIWWIKHFTADQVLVSERIEITMFPEIIKSHPDDIQQAAKNIKKIIENSQPENIYE